MTYMKYSEFEDFAPSSPGKVRANHISSSCTGGRDSMIVERKTDGSISAYCFRCGQRGWKPDNTINPYKHRETTPPPSTPLELPNDLMYYLKDWPVEAVMYLHKLDLYDKKVTIQWSFAYSPSANRVYFVNNYDNDVWLGRALHSCDNKWIENIGDKYSRCIVSPINNSVDANYIIVVEDLVSAIAVNSLGMSAMCLFGSEFTSRHRYMIVKAGYEGVGVWLDNDNAKIQMTQAAISQQVSAMSIPTCILKSSDDPKEMLSSYKNKVDSDLTTQLKGMIHSSDTECKVCKVHDITKATPPSYNNTIPLGYTTRVLPSISNVLRDSQAPVVDSALLTSVNPYYIGGSNV